jgi:3-isopropylmalate/(R)-2-methylmalate dehydratase small subunit
MEKLRGKVWKYGANVDTDVIIPARYLNLTAAGDLAKHCMEDIDALFAKNVASGDIIVATANFGCGSSREHAPVSIKAAGVSCVIAHSFARIFYRNAINIGLPILECADAVDSCAQGDILEIELATGAIKNLRTGQTHAAKPYPPFMLQIIQAGGLVPYTQARLAGKA